MTTAQDLSVRRCAVCRINMKCRFVYVDDGVEKLVGFTREELFGKSFLDFIDEADRPHFSRILEQRNHFEANFDITAVNLLSRDQQRIPANVVVSLNFIAGNPVNFQIIIDAGCQEEPIQRIALERLDYREFVDKLLYADPNSYVADALDGIYEYLGDEQCLIYQVSGEQIEPIYWHSAQPKTGISMTQEPKALLQWVAISEETYSFLDPDSARRAVERSGLAPNEYIKRLRLGGELYLVRVLLEEITETEEQRNALRGIDQAISLAERLAPQAINADSALVSEGSSVLNDLRSSLASAMRIATMLGKSKTESH
ncbi:MAG: PAS domain S-box protein [bacterium]|nr:PAS domain S-box protein [bacterium]